MGNQLVKKSQTDCQILIFGEKSSGKSTLFQQLISVLSETSGPQRNLAVRSAYTEEYFLHLIEVTIEVGKLCLTSENKFQSDKCHEILEKFIKLPKSNTKERVLELRLDLVFIWKQSAMKENLKTLKNYETAKQ
jgi:GTPase SAR1 family protein